MQRLIFVLLAAAAIAATLAAWTPAVAGSEPAAGAAAGSARIKAAQRLLNQRFTEAGLAVRVSVDGRLGPATVAALHRFQDLRGLRVSGRLTGETRRELRRRATPLTGLDVSQWQGSVDWRQVRAAGHSFAVAKTSEGGDWRDPSWSPARASQIRAAGLALGVYHFLRPRADRAGKVEARFAVRVARWGGWRRGDLPLVADLETTTLGPAGTCAYARSFASEVRRLTGHRPIVYTGPSFASANLAGCRALAANRLWIAHYGVSAPTIPPPWWSYTLWQWTSKGRSAGVNGDVDLNRMPGGRPLLRRLRMRRAGTATARVSRAPGRPKPVGPSDAPGVAGAGR